MKSVGEVMAIGRTFKEALGRPCARSRSAAGASTWTKAPPLDELKRRIADRRPRSAVAAGRGAARWGCRWTRPTQLTAIDPWFLTSSSRWSTRTRPCAGRARRCWTTRAALARGQAAGHVRPPDHEAGRRQAKRTCARRATGTACARSTSASTPAPPSSRRYALPVLDLRGAARSTSRGAENEARVTDKKKIIILGGGPNRIGQGIEFDYCCVHAVHGAARGGLRDHHGQLQPRDGVDRLRHLATACTSSRSPSRTCWRSSTSRSPRA